ncbi:hypothetical protein AbraIFM66951_012003 [Aspergillus brasiliensis]|uniref:T6SS Phospholipase effector Tle1-like catalytic domain-containing protein n=1 Tax=Aspergillus brasiliensis TaxID=319629 RepID=A0A9W5YVK2_9EURO|nr:hypothetical protein AbraCBS73388_011587 [Aspergillus brasiliensis]GKZ48240.1 hypothetical protein AbraIFM66951_012003 [Aspergillus brasiliensis]
MSDPKKRIVLCFDGTSQASNHGREEVPSNATKLSLSLERWFTNDDGVRSPQIVYYDSGVGTDEVGEIGKDFTAGLGKTLDQKVCEAYHFIATNYCDGDELYFFGFSRGAFTARATAGLICRVGICTREDLSQFWKMWAVYTHLPSSGDIKTTKWYEPVKPGGKIIIEIHGTKKELIEGEGKDWIDRTQKSLDNLNIQVVGVWDTVGSLGLPRNQFIDVDYWNKQHQFYNTEIHPSGGSDNKNGDLEFLANTTFAWMVDRCLPLLDFSLERVINLLESHDKSVQGLIKQYAQTGQTGTFWTGGPLLDSFKGLVYRTQGSLVRTPGLTQRMRDDNMGELETYLDRLLEANDGVLGPRMMDENPQTRQSKDWSEVVKSFPKPLLRV